MMRRSLPKAIWCYSSCVILPSPSRVHFSFCFVGRYKANYEKCVWHARECVLLRPCAQIGQCLLLKKCLCTFYNKVRSQITMFDTKLLRVYLIRGLLFISWFKIVYQLYYHIFVYSSSHTVSGSIRQKPFVALHPFRQFSCFTKNTHETLKQHGINFVWYTVLMTCNKNVP